MGRTSTRASAADSSSAPKPECANDGTFRIRCSDGEVLTGNYASRMVEPISHGPEYWLADVNADGFTNTLRIYRVGADNKPAEVHLYSFDPSVNNWTHSYAKASTSKTTSTSDSENRWHKPTSLLRRFARKLRRWLGGDDRLHLLGDYHASKAIYIGETGERSYDEHPFFPFTICANGDVYIKGVRYKKNKPINREVGNATSFTWFFRKRGYCQQLFIFMIRSVGQRSVEGPYVLLYNYNTWWQCVRKRQGSLYDDRRRRATRIYIWVRRIAILWLALYFIALLFSGK